MLRVFANTAYHEVRRTCDSDGNCFEGWPYTMNDGFLGQSSNNATAADDMLVVRQTIKTMAHNPDVWNACYGMSVTFPLVYGMAATLPCLVLTSFFSHHLHHSIHQPAMY